MANALFMVSNPINNRSRDSVDTFTGRDWIVILRVKFRKTGGEFRVWRAILLPFWLFSAGEGAAVVVCLSGAGSGRRPGGMQSPDWSEALGGSPCEALPEAVRAAARPRLPTAIGRRQFANLRLPLRSSARHRSPCRRRAPRCSARGRSAVFRCPRPELRKKIRGSRLWLSARARVPNSGPEDLWLSATGAVVNGGRLPLPENAGPRRLFRQFTAFL